MKPFKLKKILTLFVITTFSTLIFAQTSTINLEINDAKNTPLPFANVDVLVGKEIKTSGTTDEKGKVTLSNVPLGKIKIIANSAGFIDFIQEYEITQTTQDLGKLNLKMQDQSTLATVTVRAETSTYRTEIDKRVVDVGKDLVSAGANVADVLNNIPSLSVDGQSGELSLRGNENVRVFIDGKPSNIPTAQLLKQLPSNSISKIEIITQPSAKYDPDGNSGIINIVTVKNKREGYNIGMDAGYTIGRKSRYNAGINGNYNTGKFNFFGNYSGNFGKNEFLGNVTNFTNENRQNFSLLNDSNAHNFKVGFDYFINDKTALTFYTGQNYNNDSSLSDFKVSYFDTPNSIEKNITDSDGDSKNSDYSLNFKREFKDTDNYIELDALYSKFTDTDFSNFNNQTPDINNYIQDSDSERNTIRLNLNYGLKMDKIGKFESGLQFRQEKVESLFLTNEIQNVYDDNDNLIETLIIGDRNFDWTRNIYSAYTNYNNKWNKFGLQLGLRIENVDETGIFDYFNTPDNPNKSDYDNTYFQFYPSTYFTYDVTDKTTFSLNYSRRIDRPGIGQISPIREWNAPLISSYGNPDLKPQLTNSFEFGILKKFKNGTLNFNIFYRIIEDQFYRTLTTDASDPDKVILSFANYDQSDSYGLEISSNYKFTKWFSTNASFDIFNNKIQVGNTAKDATPWNLRLNNNFKISKNFSIQNFVMYRGKNIFAQGEMKPMWRMDLGARYTFMDGKANLSARMSDIFKTFYAQADIDTPFISEGNFRWEAQTFFIGFSYNFGGKVKARTDKHQNNEQQGGGGGIGF